MKSDEKTISGIVKYMKQCSSVERKFFSEIIMLLRVYLVPPPTNTVSGKSESTMRRIKN